MNLQYIFKTLPQNQKSIFEFEMNYEELLILNAYLKYIDHECYTNNKTVHDATLLFWWNNFFSLSDYSTRNLYHRFFSYIHKNRKRLDVFGNDKHGILYLVNMFNLFKLINHNFYFY